MTTFPQSHYSQTLTYWERSGLDSVGDPQFNDPVQIEGRLIQNSGTVFNSSGEEVDIKGYAYVERDVAEGDFLMLGESEATDPLSVETAYRVVGFKKVPTMGGGSFQRRAFF